MNTDVHLSTFAMFLQKILPENLAGAVSANAMAYYGGNQSFSAMVDAPAADYLSYSRSLNDYICCRQKQKHKETALTKRLPCQI